MSLSNLYAATPGFDLYAGDAEATLWALHLTSGRGAFHCVVTSPPYYRQRDYGEGQLGQEGTVGEYVEALGRVFDAAAALLEPTGSLWLNLGDKYERGELLGIPWLVSERLRAAGWKRRAFVVWHKPDAPPESAGSRRPALDHEAVLMMTPPGGGRWYYGADDVRVPYSEPINRKGAPVESGNTRGETSRGMNRLGRKLRPDPRGRLLRSVWSINRANTNPTAEKAVMPLELAETCVLAGCPPGGVVLDPFLGSGTTAHAALKHGRRCVGVELREEACRKALERVPPPELLGIPVLVSDDAEGAELRRLA